jgi:ABC-type multidrug transport system permease subunit
VTVAQQIPPTQVPPAPSGTSPRNGRWSGFNHLLVARLLELKREPEVIFWVFGFPVLLALGLGIAFRNKPADITPVAIVAGPGADGALSLLQHSPRSSSIRAVVVAEAEALQGFRLGKYDLVIVPNDANSFQYRYDPARPESVLSRAEVDDALQAAAGRTNPVPTTAVASSEPGSRYIDFLIPGLLGMNLMNSGMWGIGFALVDMRQRKLLKRFVGTPMRRSEFLLSIMLVRLLFAVFDMVFLAVFGYLAFGVECRGSVPALAAVMLLGGAAFAGIGLLVACRAQTIESISGMMNLIMMPMWIASGVFFSAERFPEFLQPVIQALPLTCLVNALRGVMLDGDSLMAQWKPLLILIVWGSGSFTIALLISTWSILSIGFLIASVVPTARFAQPIGAIILYPMIGISGLFSPIGALPPLLKWIARALPLGYAVPLLRGVWNGD